MALCITCSGDIRGSKRAKGGCTAPSCNNVTAYADYRYCPHCAEELGRCECCGKRQEKQHQIED
ncbi:MAG: hypothetical protein WC668_02620 [Patescibacteria group bacterium]|jgi:hypothetical protein